MTTIAFHEGRTAGYYGNVKSDNPYLRGWARHGIDYRWAHEWRRGYDYGEMLRTASPADLMRELSRLPPQ